MPIKSGRKFNKMLDTGDTQSPKQCPLCGRGDLEAYNSSLYFWKCLDCGLLFKSIMPAESTLDELYIKAWTDSLKYKGQTGGTSLELAKAYSQKLAASLDLKNFAGLKILDFGAGRGDMLIALSKLGAEVYGIDPYGYQHLKNNNFKAFRDIKDIPKGLLFDGIVANDVVEHIFYPLDTIKALYNILNTHGWLYIATPNVNSLNAKLLMSHWRELYNPSHIYLFAPDCLETIFAKLGIFQYKRLFWPIKYGGNILQKFIHAALQSLQLDGELRYILHKASPQKEIKSDCADQVGVVLINCNGGKFTIPCIRSLLSGTIKPHKIIVVDNASTDGSDNEIAASFPGIQLIRNKTNIGFAAGNNIGIRELLNQGYEYIWILNNDTELDADCLRRQYNFLESNPNIAGCCGKILYSDFREKIWYAGTQLNRFALRVRSKGMLETDNGQHDLPQKTLFITGCSMFIRSKVWQKVGTFYEKFFIYYEDFDWCLRAEKQNLDLWYLPEAVIYHKVSGTMGKTNERQTPLVTPPRVTYLIQRNHIFILRRFKSWLSFLFIFVFLEIPRALYYSMCLVFSKRFDNISALWEGTYDGFFK